MASISRASPPSVHFRKNPFCIHSSPSTLHFASFGAPRLRALITSSDAGRVGSPDAYTPDLLKKPVISQPEDDEEGESEDEGDRESGKSQGTEWIDWEDQILEDTVPLVGFVRMILHSGKYRSGERLSAEHQKSIMERLLPYHPEYEKKIGCGIDYITVGYHPDFETSRCLFIVRKDGEMVDFSYWKCIKGLIRKNYPLYADSFILRHFRRKRRGE